ncbi:MAG: response regulator [Candidatus Obscuribacterales bacterium]|nr:response regulator [Candidatus Obscuribacterales bacterium]
MNAKSGDFNNEKLMDFPWIQTVIDYVYELFLDTQNNEHKSRIKHVLGHHPHLNLKKEELSQSINQSAHLLKKHLANDHDLPPHILAALSEDSDPELLRRLADHPGLGCETLDKLVSHPNAEVRYSAAQNPALSKDHLEQLLNDPDPSVRYQLAESPLIDPAVLTRLCSDENAYVAFRAAKTLDRFRTDKSTVPADSISGDRILIAEDDHFMRRLLEKQVQGLGYSVAGMACDGKEAVSMASTLLPGLILMDIGLPEMNGIEAAQNLKRSMPQCKIIMLTAHDEEAEIIAAFSAGADGYFLKQTDYKLLGIAMSTVLRGDSWIDPAIAPTLLRSIINKSSKTPPQSESKNRDPVVTVLNLVDDYRKTKQFDQAFILAETAVKLAQLEYGATHANAISALAKLAELHYERAEYAESEILYFRILSAKEQDLQQARGEIEKDLSTLVECAERTGNRERAATYAAWNSKLNQRS